MVIAIGSSKLGQVVTKMKNNDNGASCLYSGLEELGFLPDVFTALYATDKAKETPFYGSQHGCFVVEAGGH